MDFPHFLKLVFHFFSSQVKMFSLPESAILRTCSKACVTLGPRVVIAAAMIWVLKSLCNAIRHYEPLHFSSYFPLWLILYVWKHNDLQRLSSLHKALKRELFRAWGSRLVSSLNNSLLLGILSPEKGNSHLTSRSIRTGR